MFKAIILLQRRADMDRAQFAHWWLGAHAALARGLPGLRGLRFNLIDMPEGGDVDGVSELWFDDQAAFEAAYASDHGRAVAADSMAHVARRERLFVTEHGLHGDASPQP
jgi:uncharacterized protein (TIGR02118 family)